MSSSSHFTPQESGSDLNSIVDPDVVLTPWRKLSRKEHVTLWHEKYWGKTMAAEEQEWLSTQAQVPGRCGDKNGAGTDAVDDDYLPGCYLLDLSPVINRQLWIRADYIRIYNSLEAHYKKDPRPSWRAPAAFITGQPGVGKSYWIYYALRRRLAEMKPVIWYRSGTCYLFVDEGVYQIPRDFPTSAFKTFVWTLVDSDQSKDGVPPDLVPQDTCHYVIFATAPCKDRWSRLHKTTRAIRAIMNPWTRGELLLAASLLLPDISEHQINRAYDFLGPTPRLCLELILDQERTGQHGDLVDRAVSNDVKADELEQLIRNTASLDMDETSEKILCISREDRNNVYSSPVVASVNLSVQSRLANRFRSLEQAERRRIHISLARAPWTRATAGIFSGA